MMKVKMVLCAMLAGLFLYGWALAKMYRWVDEPGRIHYSDAPSQDQQSSSVVESIPSPTYDYGPSDASDSNTPKTAESKDTKPAQTLTKIEWYEHDRGLNLASLRRKPAIMVLYAKWCPACKRYWKTFEDGSVIAKSSKFIMIRVDVDKEPELSKKYRLDGGYIPKAIALYPNGKIMHQIYPDREYKYNTGIGVGNILNLMQTVSEAAKKT
jgi:thiol-disulfide isomerase/thioredoxin